MEIGNIKERQNKQLLVIGITGIFGSGKTTVGKIFQKEGFPYFSLDEIVSEVLKNKEVIEKTKNLFGEEIIKEGKIDRKTISKTIFTDKEIKKRYEDIVHPFVFKIFHKIIFDYKQKGGIIIFEVPLLFETKSELFFHKIIVVSSTADKILSRLKKKFSSEDINNRLANQIPLKEKEGKATYIISNAGSIYKTTIQVRKIIKDLQKEFI